ncbi:MAG: hypothetical protein PHQ36_03720 [Anaerolineales bacterium]|nr:hypothetical protein [Anaerolineales bacterium]
MQLKRYSIFVLSAIILLLGACNLPSAGSTPEIPIASQLPMILTSAAASVPSATSTVVQPTPTVTLFYESTATLAVVQRTPTLTLFYEPTPTSMPSWTECPLVITRTDTKAGDVLHILRCEDKLEYDLGPFAKGIYAAGPNNNFIVYVADNGMVYAARMGEQYISVIVNPARERFFVAVNKNAPPKFSISFIGEAPRFKLVLEEKIYKQKRVYNLPLWLTE